MENVKDPENKGLKAYIRPNGRIPCGVNNFNTSTSRSSHSVMVNIPGAGALYGKECRRIIIAPENKVLVGADQASAQLQIAGYYANNEAYCKAVSEGSEFKVNDKGNEILHPETGKPWYIGESGHCVNARAFTLITDEEWKRAIATQDQELIHTLSIRRGKSKGGSFATIFGASGKKVATTLGIPEKLGVQKRKAFLENIGLDKVISLLERMVHKNSRAGGGYIELPFGYYVWSKAKHSQFNYLDQGTESCCQKWAENYFHKEIIKQGLNNKCKKIMSYHDEYLVESDEDCAEEVGFIMSDSFEKASKALWEWHDKHSEWFVGEYLPDFQINLSGGYKKGKNYYDVH